MGTEQSAGNVEKNNANYKMYSNKIIFYIQQQTLITLHLLAPSFHIWIQNNIVIKTFYMVYYSTMWYIFPQLPLRQVGFIFPVLEMRKMMQRRYISMVQKKCYSRITELVSAKLELQPRSPSCKLHALSLHNVVSQYVWNWLCFIIINDTLRRWVLCQLCP